MLGSVIDRNKIYYLYYKPCQTVKINFMCKILEFKANSNTNNTNHNHYILSNPVYEYYKTVINIYYFRGSEHRTMNPSLVEHSTEFLTQTAIRIMKKCRASITEPTDEILVPKSTENHWRKDGSLSKVNLIREITGQYPNKESSHDADSMHYYLLKVSPDGLQNPQLEDTDIYLPAGAPLLDFLSVTMDRTESWKVLNKDEISAYQKNRGLTYRMLEEVKIREIVIGQSSDEQIKDAVEWFWTNHNKDQEFYPTQVVSLSCEYLTISLYDLYRMSGKIICPEARRISPRIENAVPDLPEDKWKQLPVKVIVGNGISYALVISIVLNRDHDDEYLVEKLIIQESILEFLVSLPLCMGLGIKKEVEDLEYYYETISGKPLNMKGSVDLSELALLCGYAASSRCMTAMGIQVLGTVLNKTVSRGDDKWAWSWGELQGSLQVYAMGIIRFSHMSYNILSSILIRDFFPDPDIACKYFNSTNQWEVFAWFLELLSYSLDGLVTDSNAYRNAVNRIDLMKCLHYTYPGSREMMDDCPSRIKLWIKLLGDWPSITAGGCRSLIQARSWFTTQARILKRSGFKSSSGLEICETSEYLEDYARFGVPLEKANQLDVSRPVRGHVGLSHTGFRGFPLLSINPRSTKCSTIGKFCSKQKRTQKMIIFEWSRLNPNRIHDFLKRMRSDGNYRKFYAKIYDGLRQMHERLHDQDGIRVPELDEKQDGKIKSQLTSELAKIEKIEMEKVARNSRIDYLRNTLSARDNVERSLWRDKLPNLPYRRGKRARSRSRSKPPSKKTKTVGNSAPAIMPEEEIAELVADETENEDVVILEQDEMEDLTEPVTEAAEIVEAGIYRNSDDEYELETQFSGHLV